MADESILESQKLIRKRINHDTVPLEIQGYNDERSRLHELIHRTVILGESNSVVIVGPRGSGKTMLLKSVLDELLTKKEISTNLLIVKLNGLVHTDDRIALKDITRQLQLENAVGDKVFGSFSENLQFLLDSLKSGSQKSKCVLFILEEFDLFSYHKNQTLLYNLFDVSQSKQTPICVVGLTCRLDVIELLEKRVKSRFSHRQLYLFNNYDFKSYLKIFINLLTLPRDFCDKKFSNEWNKHIEKLSKDSAILDVLKQQHMMTKDVRALQTLLLIPIANISTDHPFPKASDFVRSAQMLTTDSKASMLHGISVLELSLVIAMKHLTEIYDGEPFNFEMVYNEYQKFSQKKSSMQTFGRAVVLKAFEHLQTLELVRPNDTGNSKIQKEYRQMSLQVESSQILDALQKYPNCPTEVKQWATTSVI